MDGADIPELLLHAIIFLHSFPRILMTIISESVRYHGEDELIQIHPTILGVTERNLNRLALFIGVIIVLWK